MKILICGSRDWDDYHPIYLTLVGAKALAESLEEPLELVHGAARGADSRAAELAKSLDIPCHAVPANWSRDGRAAGPLRNQRMLDEHKIDVIYAFRLPGKSNGTDDMVRRGREAGIPTYVIGRA